MLIIIEGPDCAGKTTLADRIATYLAVKYPRHKITRLHKGPPKLHPLDEYAVPLLDYRPGVGEHLILDRWHWGELVYPSILKRPTRMTMEIFAYIEILIVQRGGVVVPVNAPIPELWKRFDARGEDEPVVPRDKIAASAVRFADVADASYATPWVWTQNHMFTVDEIVSVARYTEKKMTTTSDFVSPVTTSSRPGVLLLGDTRVCDGSRCAHQTQHFVNGTAFMPYGGTSGLYLLRALLETAGPPFYGAKSFGPHWPAFANAADVDNVEMLWNLYGEPSIVALGVNAHKALNALKLPHAVVPHPQYVRRFHHSATAEYGSLIWSVAGTERNELKWKSSQGERVGASTVTSSS